MFTFVRQKYTKKYTIMSTTPSLRVVFDRKHLSTPSTSAAPRLGLVQLEVRYQGQKHYIAIGRCYKDQFGTIKKISGKEHVFGETVHSRIDADTLNQTILDHKRRILADYQQCIQSGLPWSLTRLTQSAATQTFLSWADAQIDSSSIRSTTRTQYHRQLNVLRTFGHITTFADLTLPNLLQFDTWLRQRPGRRPGTTATTGYIFTVHTVLHKFCRRAKLLGLIAENPYDRFPTSPHSSAPRTALTSAEVAAIAAWQPSTTRANNKGLLVRNLALLQCYTGVAFADLFAQPWAEARKHGHLIGYRHKTGIQFVIRLTPLARQVLEQLNWVIPPISNQSYNAHLKRILADVGIKKPISSHCLRHTFATTYGLNAGVPVEVLAKMLGHADISTTQIYAKMLPDTVLAAFDLVDQAQQKK